MTELVDRVVEDCNRLMTEVDEKHPWYSKLRKKFASNVFLKKVMKVNNCYQRYQELGGIINEGDYNSALARAKDTTTLDIRLIKQSELIARVAGIELCNEKGSLDQRTILYGVLRSDKPEGVKYHHCQMSDQRLFAEVLRMLGDVDSLNKLIDTHPNISFSWKTV